MKFARLFGVRHPRRESPAGMVSVGGGAFWMGSDDHYGEERPCRRVTVAPFHIDAKPVTNAQFQAFVDASGYQTLAEQMPDPAQYPDAAPELLKPGSSVFIGTSGPVPLDDPLRWWSYRPGARWDRPEGPGSHVKDRLDHPVVHIAHVDARAYAAWSGKRLATEVEWEYAARGGLDRATYAWGNDLAPNGQIMANYWTGDFPWNRDRYGAWTTTSPVANFPANGFGLYDMIGNVWEWTADDYSLSAPSTVVKRCCASERGPKMTPATKVLKGGSHLCAESYCQRYRPAARHPQTEDTSTSHIGFRCVQDV